MLAPAKLRGMKSGGLDARFFPASPVGLFVLLGLAKLPDQGTGRVSYEAKSIGATGGWFGAAWNANHLRRHEDCEISSEPYYN